MINRKSYPGWIVLAILLFGSPQLLARSMHCKLDLYHEFQFDSSDVLSLLDQTAGRFAGSLLFHFLVGLAAGGVCGTEPGAVGLYRFLPGGEVLQASLRQEFRAHVGQLTYGMAPLEPVNPGLLPAIDGRTGL